MSLQQTEIHLVQQTCAMVRVVADTLTQLFYRRLFELDPTVEPLFAGDMGNQRAKFMATLQFIVEVLDRPDTLRTTVARLGREHAQYHVRDEHYDVVGEALLWALAETLGPACTPAVASAWRKLYTLVADCMKASAASR